MQHATHALVIGGSLSGLLAGRVLANHFDRVTIIERDIYPDYPAPRKGLPQSGFPHSLMMRGLQILETLFPGLKTELLQQGAIELDACADIAYFSPFGRVPQYPSDLTLLTFSRDLLDWTIRRRLATFPNIEFLEGYSVTELVANAERTVIEGVSLQICDRSIKNASKSNIEDQPDRDQNTQEIHLKADLVIDASGKGSHAPQWLKALGYAPPQEIEVNAFLGYTARIYQCPTSLPTDWKLVLIQAAPPEQHRGGAIFPIEGNRWIVSLAGGDHDYPPTDEAGFVAFARSLPTSVIYDAIQNATPLTPIYTYRGNENRLRHYDRLSRQPANFVVVGHATCAFNPTYGQGMTVAALTAERLDQFLQKHPIAEMGKAVDQQNRTRQLQRDLAKAHQDAWLLATGQDSRFRSATQRNMAPITPWINRYMDELSKVALKRTTVQHTLMEVMQMLKPATSLFHPQIMLAILQEQLQRFAKPHASARS